MSGKEVQFSFLGGASSIGASCTVIEVAGARFIVDCGVRFDSSHPLPDLSLLASLPPDAIVVTHAHSDHTGGLPVLSEAFPGVPVLATPPTIDLMRVLLQDALKLMNSPERDGEFPLYSQEQVDRLFRAAEPLPHNQPRAIGPVEVTMLPASHILGASMVHLATPAGNVLITGDYSVSGQLTVPALTRPALPVDIVISESTYGERLHEDRTAAEQRLIDQIRVVTENGGRVLIPAFAVGRAQEILLILQRAFDRGHLARLPVHVDGMVRSVCGIYGRHERYVTRTLAHAIRQRANPFYTDEIQPVESPSRRADILRGGACVIVASSGMLSGGASVAYAQEMVARPADAILITGYQDEESPGRTLLNLTEQEGPRELKLGESTVEVACRVEKYGLSAHADRLQMINLIQSLRPRTVVLVHGDASARRSLAEGLGHGDVALVENGSVISRSGSGRRRPPPRRSLDGLDLAAARRLLGPPQDVPIRTRQVAEAWYGGKPRSAEVELLTNHLEELGLVRRDDHRRNVVWVLRPGETDVLEDEHALEVELKEENPKGSCLALCMRLRVDPPELERQVEGAFHVATVSLELDGERLRTEPCRAASRKVAEQLAYRRLLELIDENEAPVQAVSVTEEAVRRHSRTNPKGRLLELCTKRGHTDLEFEEQPTVEGYRVRTRVALPRGDSLVSLWYAAPAKRAAEHAAAADLLDRLEGMQANASAGDARAVSDGMRSGPSATAPSPADVASSQAGSRVNARMILNEMRQAGVLGEFGYEQVEQRGPSHQPVFSFRGWATTPDGRRFETEPIEAGSKKAGQALSADHLLDLLRRTGLTS